MIDKNQAKKILYNTIQTKNEYNYTISAICPENFGWIFLLTVDSRGKGIPTAYLIDKKREKIKTISRIYIKLEIKNYQKSNNYPIQIKNPKVYDFRPKPSNLTLLGEISFAIDKLRYKINKFFSPPSKFKN